VKKSAEIIGLPLISLSEGTELGTVQDLLINAQAGTVAALVINDGRWYLGAKLLPFNKVMAIGDYAVTVEASSDLTGVTAEYEPLLAEDIKVIGTKVLTKSGRMQGVVTELFVDDTGKIAACEITADDTVSQIPANQIRTYGKQVLVIDDADQPATFVATQSPAAPKEPVPAFTAPTQQPAAAYVKPVATNPINTPEPDLEDAAKRFEEKQRKYLLGKKAARRIETDNGLLIVEQGGEITEEVLQKAKLAGKFVELSMNIQ